MALQTEPDPRLRERIDSERRYHEAMYRSASVPLELSFDLATERQRRPHNLIWAHYDAVLDHFANNLEGRQILEIGCGTGNVALNLAKQRAVVDACDVSEEAIAICRRRAQHNELSNVEFHAKSFEDVELPENYFDAVVGTMILHHIDIPAAADKIVRLLKPGGLGLFAEWKEYPIVDWVRRTAFLRDVFPPGGVQGYATEFERKLSRDDLDAIRRRFPDMTLAYRYCLCGKVQYFSPAWAARLEPLDYRMLKTLPALQRFTDGVVIKFTKRSSEHLIEQGNAIAVGKVAGIVRSSAREPRVAVAERVKASEVLVHPLCEQNAPHSGSVADVKQTPNRRLVLLLGTARSGTTWLGNILNSSPRSVYSHEPLLRYADEELRPVLERIKKTGVVSPAEREMVLDHWSRAYFAVRRPPFFVKEYSAWPAKATWAAWLAVRAAGRGFHVFQRVFSPHNGARYDLVAKQGGLAVHGPNFVGALEPEALIIIIRHPCAVIASVRRGQKLGLMERRPRGRWFDDHLPLAEELGYSRREIEKMSDGQFEALDWLIENAIYERLLEKHPNGRLVVYAHLCRDPLGSTEKLFQALGWDVTPQTRRFLHQTTTRRTSRLTSLVTASHSYFSVYRPPTEEVDAWRRTLSRREQDEIMAIARPLAERYWPEPIEERPGPSLQ
jgi:SAM-dependent methyltransferase